MTFGKFVRLTSFVLLGIFIVITANFLQNPQTTSQHAAVVASPYSQAIQLIEATLDNWVKSGPQALIALHENSHQRYQDMDYFCSDVAEAAKLLQPTDQTRATQYAAYAQAIADWLIAHDHDNGGLLPEWGVPDAFDAFQDGTINPANQEYAVQDGTVSHCLLSVYQATGQTKYLTIAQAVLRNYVTYWQAYTTNIDPLCSNCGYFYYSTNHNDFGHYVKNAAALMLMAQAKLATITQDANDKLVAQQMVNSLLYEINIRHNFNYLGFNDPYYASKPSVDIDEMYTTMGLERAERELGQSTDPNYRKAAAALYDNFVACGGPCFQSSRPLFACEIAPDYVTAKAYCQQYIADHSMGLSDDQGVSGILDGLSAFGSPSLYQQPSVSPTVSPTISPTVSITNFPTNPPPKSPTVSPVLPSRTVYMTGDINHDGIINILDYNILLSCFGLTDQQSSSSCPNPSIADLNRDGVVDGVAYNIWLRSFIQYEKEVK